MDEIMDDNIGLWMEPESMVEYASKYGRSWARKFLEELDGYNIKYLLFDVKIPDGSLYFSSKDWTVCKAKFTSFLAELSNAAKDSKVRIFPRIVCFLDYSWGVREWSIDRDNKPVEGKICPTNDQYREYLLKIINQILEYGGIGGIVLDAIEFVDPDATGTRTLDADLCFCSTCGNAFILKFKKDFFKWKEWRCDQINKFVEKVEMYCEVKSIPLGVEVDFDKRKEYAIGLRTECGIDLASLSQISDFFIFHINALSRAPLDNDTEARRLLRILNTQISELRDMQFELDKFNFYISVFGLTGKQSAELKKILSNEMVKYDGLFLHVPSKVDEFIKDFSGGK